MNDNEILKFYKEKIIENNYNIKEFLHFVIDDKIGNNFLKASIIKSIYSTEFLNIEDETTFLINSLEVHENIIDCSKNIIDCSDRKSVV